MRFEEALEHLKAGETIARGYPHPMITLMSLKEAQVNDAIGIIGLVNSYPDQKSLLMQLQEGTFRAKQYEFTGEDIISHDWCVISPPVEALNPIKRIYKINLDYGSYGYTFDIDLLNETNAQEVMTTINRNSAIGKTCSARISKP